MTTSRAHRPFKGRTGLYCLAIFVIIGVIYYHQSNQAKLQILKHSEQRCLLGQELLSSQLQVVTDYKGRMEQKLSAEKMEHSRAMAAIRTHQQGEMDSLRQHHSLLQSQFDDLTLECSKVRESIKLDRESLDKYAKSFTDEQSIKKNLQKQLDAKSQEAVNIQNRLNDFIHENERLKLQIKMLSKENHVSQPSMFTQQDHISNKNFSKQVTISNNVYLVSVNTEDLKTEGVHGIVKSTASIHKEQFKSQSIPEGVAPELMVNEDFNMKIEPRNENMNTKKIDSSHANLDTKSKNDLEDVLDKHPHNADNSINALKMNADIANLKIIHHEDAHREDELFKLDNNVNLDSDISNAARKNENDHDFNEINNNLDHAEPAAQNIFEEDDEEPDD